MKREEIKEELREARNKDDMRKVREIIKAIKTYHPDLYKKMLKEGGKNDD